MKVLKIKYYKRPTLKTGKVSCNFSEFTVEELEDAKRLVDISLESKRAKEKKNEN